MCGRIRFLESPESSNFRISDLRFSVQGVHWWCHWNQIDNIKYLQKIIVTVRRWEGSKMENNITKTLCPIGASIRKRKLKYHRIYKELFNSVTIWPFFSIFRGDTIHCLGLKWKICASFKNPTYNHVEILERFILWKTHNIFHLRHAEATTQHFFYLSHISAAICSFSLGCDEFIQGPAKVHILLQIKLKVLMHI